MPRSVDEAVEKLIKLGLINEEEDKEITREDINDFLERKKENYISLDKSLEEYINDKKAKWLDLVLRGFMVNGMEFDPDHTKIDPTTIEDFDLLLKYKNNTGDDKLTSNAITALSKEVAKGSNVEVEKISHALANYIVSFNKSMDSDKKPSRKRKTAIEVDVSEKEEIKVPEREDNEIMVEETISEKKDNKTMTEETAVTKENHSKELAVIETISEEITDFRTAMTYIGLLESPLRYNGMEVHKNKEVAKILSLVALSNIFAGFEVNQEVLAMSTEEVKSHIKQLISSKTENIDVIRDSNLISAVVDKTREIYFSEGKSSFKITGDDKILFFTDPADLNILSTHLSKMSKFAGKEILEFDGNLKGAEKYLDFLIEPEKIDMQFFTDKNEYEKAKGKETEDMYLTRVVVPLYVAFKDSGMDITASNFKQAIGDSYFRQAYKMASSTPQLVEIEKQEKYMLKMTEGGNRDRMSTSLLHLSRSKNDIIINNFLGICVADGKISKDSAQELLDIIKKSRELYDKKISETKRSNIEKLDEIVRTKDNAEVVQKAKQRSI